MNCEHFIYGLFPGVGHKLLKSSKVDQMLPEEQILRLCQLSGPSQTFFPQEQVFAVSYIISRKDEYERKGTWNHTILLTVGQYMYLADLALDKHFIPHLDTPPKNPLKPLKVK